MTDSEVSADVRPVRAVVEAREMVEGAGVRLRRALGGPDLPMLDPFLLLDAFDGDAAGDARAGFPDHPHRGFETVTYLLAGRIRHEDSAGHAGVIGPGDVQWMTAGRGIVHSEMPGQDEGRIAGFQLWVNLPAARKMDPPAYQEFRAAQIPVETRPGGVEVRVVAGRTGTGAEGPVRQPLTDPLYLDVRLPAGTVLEEPVPDSRNAFAYVFEGALAPDGEAVSCEIGRHWLAVLGDGDRVLLRAGPDGARLLLVAGRPIGEPVKRRGPFVMNTAEEVRAAEEDYRLGRLA